MKRRYCFNCGKPRHTLLRVKIDKNQKWLYMCDKCVPQFEKLPSFQRGTDWTTKPSDFD